MHPCLHSRLVSDGIDRWRPSYAPTIAVPGKVARVAITVIVVSNLCHVEAKAPDAGFTGPLTRWCTSYSACSGPLRHPSPTASLVQNAVQRQLVAGRLSCAPHFDVAKWAPPAESKISSTLLAIPRWLLIALIPPNLSMGPVLRRADVERGAWRVSVAN
jgi:hypothetical protein